MFYLLSVSGEHIFPVKRPNINFIAMSSLRIFKICIELYTLPWMNTITPMVMCSAPDSTTTNCVCTDSIRSIFGTIVGWPNNSQTQIADEHVTNNKYALRNSTLPVLCCGWNSQHVRTKSGLRSHITPKVTYVKCDIIFNPRSRWKVKASIALFAGGTVLKSSAEKWHKFEYTTNISNE